MTSSTTSPTVALLSAAAVAAAGIAYWSSASNTTAFGILVSGILRVTGKLEERQNSDKKGHNNNSTSNEDNNRDDENEGHDLNKAFVSWLDREENEHYFSRPWNNGAKSTDEELTDPHWMSEMIRNALLSTAMLAVSAAVTETVTAPSLLEDASSTLSTSSRADTQTIRDTMLSPISQLIDSEEETLCEKSFRRSFQALQKATEAMIQKEPAIREDFFNGVCVDGENNQREEEKKLGRRRSLSVSSSSSSWTSSTMSSSVGSYEVHKDDCLVEEEEEVEKLLTYLRFVEMAKEEASVSSSSSIPSKDYYGRTTGYLQRGGERMIPDANGYELLRSATMTIQDATDTQRAKVGHMAAVHRDRKELVIAVHYDGSSLSSSTADDRKRMKNILMSSIFLQQQEHSATSRIPAPSSSFFLLDQAVKSLSEEILLRYLHTNTAEEKKGSLPFLSSGYSLVLCGHSMGAALACRLGDTLTGRKEDTASEAIEVRVCAFGPPPCLPSQPNFCQDSGDSGGDYRYITSVVNNHDCVPRWTESNLVGLRTSLRWTMDRKKRHFHRYHNFYYQSHSSTDPVTAAKAGVARQLPPQIPPFSVSPRDWSAFWKNHQELNLLLPQEDIDDVGFKYIVPGKVVSIWNHSQDPMIIGAKVYLPGTRHRHPSSSDCHQLSRHHRNNHDVLGRLWVDEGMFSDHTIEAYRSNLELLLGQVANTI